MFFFETFPTCVPTDVVAMLMDPISFATKALEELAKGDDLVRKFRHFYYLTLSKPRTYKCVQSLHKPIKKLYWDIQTRR